MAVLTPPYAERPQAQAQQYLRLLVTIRYRWWRPVLGLVVLVVTFGTGAFTALGLVALIQRAGGAGTTVLDGELTEPSPVALMATNLALAAAIPAAVLAVLVAHRERAGWLVSVTGRWRWDVAARAAGVAVVLMAIAFAASAVLPVQEVSPGGEPVGWGSALLVVVVSLVTTPLQAAGEEVAFRGYLTQVIASWVRPRFAGAVVAAGVSALLFALAHGQQDLWLFADRFCFGLVASWVTLRTGGLEAAAALHAVNNVGAFTAAALSGQLESTWTATRLPWSFAVLDVLTLLAFAAYAERLARRRRLTLRSAPVGSGIVGAGVPPARADRLGVWGNWQPG